MRVAVLCVAAVSLSIGVPVAIAIMLGGGGSGEIEIRRADEAMFASRRLGFAALGALMGVGPAALSIFNSAARKLLFSIPVAIGVLGVVLIQSSDPEYLLDSVLEFGVPFATGVLGAFLVALLLERGVALLGRGPTDV